MCTPDKRKEKEGKGQKQPLESAVFKELLQCSLWHHISQNWNNIEKISTGPEQGGHAELGSVPCFYIVYMRNLKFDTNGSSRRGAVVNASD